MSYTERCANRCSPSIMVRRKVCFDGELFSGHCINCCGSGLWWSGGYGRWRCENRLCRRDYLVLVSLFTGRRRPRRPAMRAILKPKHFTDTSSYTKPVLRTGFRGLSGGQIVTLSGEDQSNRKAGWGNAFRHAGQYRPLAVKPFRPGKLALVCEGGGQRGIFTAGVLDEFMRAGFNPLT